MPESNCPLSKEETRTIHLLKEEKKDVPISTAPAVDPAMIDLSALGRSLGFCGAEAALLLCGAAIVAVVGVL